MVNQPKMVMQSKKIQIKSVSETMNIKSPVINNSSSGKENNELFKTIREKISPDIKDEIIKEAFENLDVYNQSINDEFIKKILKEIKLINQYS